MPSDLEIAKGVKLLPINEIAEQVGVSSEYLETYGKYKAKINLKLLEKKKRNSRGKLILVTGINPTPSGDGKTTISIGLAQALCHLKYKAILAIREPSLGPVLGSKGGATGGGYAQVLPMEDINLHFTGDFHAVTTANNAISALIDNHIHQGNDLKIDPKNILWRRVLDMNDRSLRKIIVGLGEASNGTMREDGFNITAASEIMAILCLSSSMEDLKRRLGDILIAYTFDKEPVYLKELKIENAVALILKDAIFPNLVQTTENTPVIIHGGPFANIAHGCNSLIATEMALSLGDYCVTEAGFGADLGAEKFLNIKTRIAKNSAMDVAPSVVVIVVTIKALKMQGGLEKSKLASLDLKALEAGLSNLAKHIETIEHFNLPYCIAVNQFKQDFQEELETLENWRKKFNHPMAFSEVWAKGGLGGISLARKVLEIMNANEGENSSKPFQFLYELDEPIADKINAIVKKVYGGRGVDFSPLALSQMRAFKKRGWDKLPVCMAKTPISLSDDPSKLGRPDDFRVSIKEIIPCLGAGFLVALAGDIIRMPGLPKEPAALKIGFDENGEIYGLF